MPYVCKNPNCPWYVREGSCKHGVDQMKTCNKLGGPVVYVLTEEEKREIRWRRKSSKQSQ